MHCFWSYMLIVYFDFGLIGAAISITLTYTLNLISVVLYIRYLNIVNPDAVQPFNKSSFQ